MQALLMDHSAIDLSLYLKQNRLLKHRKDLRRITSSAYMKSSEDRETLNKSEIKILKSKDLRLESWGTEKTA